VTRRLPPQEASRTVLFCEGNTDGTIGGSYFSLLYLVAGLRETIYHPVVIFHREHELLQRYRECAEVEVIPRRRPVHLVRESPTSRRVILVPMRLLQRSLNAFRFLATVKDYASMLRRRRVALVHLNNSVTRSHEWIWAALITRTPCVVHERGINDRFSALTRWLAPHLSAVICISEAVRRNLLDHGVTRENLRVIENGLDPREIRAGRSPQAIRRGLGLTADQPVIGLVGNIKAWKGQEVVVRSLPAVVAGIPKVACLFVGAISDADRNYFHELQQLTQTLGVADRVVFTGPTESVADYLSVMDLAIHASVAPEPFGRVLLEAMAMKLPVVGSRGGAVPEIVQHGVTGLTFAPGDSAELASHVVALLQDGTRARVMGEAGYARLCANFHISRNIARTIQLYEEILRSSNRTVA